METRSKHLNKRSSLKKRSDSSEETIEITKTSTVTKGVRFSRRKSIKEFKPCENGHDDWQNQYDLSDSFDSGQQTGLGVTRHTTGDFEKENVIFSTSHSSNLNAPSMKVPKIFQKVDNSSKVRESILENIGVEDSIYTTGPSTEVYDDMSIETTLKTSSMGDMMEITASFEMNAPKVTKKRTTILAPVDITQEVPIHRPKIQSTVRRQTTHEPQDMMADDTISYTTSQVQSETINNVRDMSVSISDSDSIQIDVIESQKVNRQSVYFQTGENMEINENITPRTEMVDQFLPPTDSDTESTGSSVSTVNRKPRIRARDSIMLYAINKNLEKSRLSIDSNQTEEIVKKCTRLSMDSNLEKLADSFDSDLLSTSVKSGYEGLKEYADLTMNSPRLSNQSVSLVSSTVDEFSFQMNKDDFGPKIDVDAQLAEGQATIDKLLEQINSLKDGMPSYEEIFMECDARLMKMEEERKLQFDRESVTSPTAPGLKILIENKLESNFKEMKNQLKPPEVLFYCFPLTPKPNELIGNKIESENLNWKFIDTFFYHGVIEFAHKVVKFLVLQIEIELNEQFNHNMEFKSVKFRCSKFRPFEKLTPFELLLHNEVLPKLPVDTHVFCKRYDALFSFLLKVDEILLKSHQDCVDVASIVTQSEGYLGREDEQFFIKKTSFEMERRIFAEIVVFGSNVNSMGPLATHIVPPIDMTPQFYKLPSGKEYLRTFLNDPFKYLVV